MHALVVDPSNVARMVIKMTLENHGVLTDSVATEQEALGLIKENIYQLFCVARTLDINDCSDLCSTLRKNPATQSTPIVMLSVSDEKDTEYFMSLGITEVFNKDDIDSFSTYIENFNQTSRSSLLHGGKILYVEDTMSIAQLTISVLEEHCYEVVHVTTGEEAVELYDKHTFDLVMTDIVLSGKMNGAGVVRYIREQETQKNIAIPVSILAMSSFDDTSRKLALFQSGINDYVPKPIMIEELLARVDSLVLNQHLFKELELQRLRLEELAMTDQLTGLYNRRYLLDNASKKMSSAIRHDIELCLVVIDIDFFKSFNDEHGHAMGDLVLSKVAKLLSDHVRNNDIAARFGGEEFVILYEHCPLNAAVNKTEELRKTLEELKPEGLTVTASFGVAQFSAEDKSFQRFFDRADEAVYKAKENGRNCVVKG